MTTVRKTRKTIARKRTKQVGTMTTIERGSLVTMALAVNANGIPVPTFFKRHFRSNAPQGGSGSSNKSGWMTGQDFQRFMKHFIKHTKVTKERPVLLILGNH
ncbi:hypothetical protein AVEN_44185-1 [Araneus ventricosus]|uniref:DDE-1 domain-containing protein n=1 Tax=Araneus ventricosus TaxID=182803 RepID=A0A4Y2RMA9_ARAVE|nr:hypothetical protein AVEN_44185-1 [Araneus ventricosus]